MNRQDLVRATEAKYGEYVAQILARLRDLPEEDHSLVEQMCLEAVRCCPESELELLWYGSDALWKHKDDNPSSPTDWEAGVLKELRDRVRYAIGDRGLEKEEEPTGIEAEGGFRFDDDDLVFFAKVARGLAPLTARPGLAPRADKAIRRAVAALKKLPKLTPEIDVQIEVSHGMGGGGFRESYSYEIKLDKQRIEISSRGSQGDPAVGTDSFTLESLQWYANGQAAHQGNRDIWLERLEYALGRDYTLNVADESGATCTETV